MEEKVVAGYIRVSDDGQIEGLSLDVQKRMLEDYCKNKGWKMFRVYVDAGITAKEIKGRKAFQQCLNDAKSGKFSAVLITKFDRPFRNTVDALITLDDLHSNNVDFISLAENIDTTTPMGRAMFTIISAFAELERKLTSGRVKDIMRDKFERGIMVCRNPVGYKWSKSKKQMIVDEKKADMIRDVFQMTADGKSYKEICEKHKIHPSSYYNIIKNPVYIGIIEFEGRLKAGKHEKIISEEIFNKINGK